MSNNQVGAVYQQIIADVVESSRVDFEEGGVDERVLEELRQGWQQKLSQLGVAQFPWDPKEAPPVMQNTPTLPSNSGMYQQIPQQQMPQQIPQQQQQQQQTQQQQPQQQQAPQAALPPMPQMNNAPRIKAEPGLEGASLGAAPPAFNNNSMAGLSAAERAAINLQGMYGTRAAESIAQLQRNAPQTQNSTQNVGNLSPQQQYAQGQAQRMQQIQQQQQQAGQQQQQQQQQQRPNLTPEQIQQYRQQQAINAQQNLQKLNGVGGAQTDGAGDDMGESIGVVSRVNSQGEEEPMGRIEIDNLIRSKIESMGQSMEGGGLMLPLKQATAAAKRNKRQRPLPKTKSATQAILQNDGGDDDDDDEVKPDLDEDAINSDLDDPDDGLNDDEDEDEAMGHIMLCMYDKVQRVKNKWKCVMKDGVLTVNGKEYVFHKATGEYEW